MTLTEWFILATVCLAGASSPGPSLALLIRSVMRDGRMAGIVFGIAHGAGILLYAGLVTMGMGAVILASVMAATLVEIAGVVFLFWLASGMVRAGLAPKTEQKGPETRLSMPLTHHARDGFMIVFLNPKIAVFFLAVFSQFLTPDQGASVRVLMVMTAFVIDTGWYVLIALVLALPQVLRLVETRTQQLELMIGIILTTVSIGLAWRLLSGN